MKSKQMGYKAKFDVGKDTNPKPTAEEMEFGQHQQNTQEFVQGIAKKLGDGLSGAFTIEE
jgi:hypothetical protein